MSPTFQFDTSGEVMVLRGERELQGYDWPRLSPGVQGCIAAMLEEVSAAVHAEREAQGRERSRFDCDFGFSDLHPDTLARIITDWERRYAQPFCTQDTLAGGRSFWTMRQAGQRIDAGFPPCTPYLSDDGKVYLKDHPPGGHSHE